MSETQFPVVTICGSMRYYQDMLIAAAELTTNGNIVLMPFNTRYAANQPADNTKIMLDDMHKTKISMSEAIYVIGAHKGESTLSEIQYAKDHYIEVRYW